jgi:hypothetical protein
MCQGNISDEERQEIYNTRFQVLQGRREVLSITGDQPSAERDAYEMLELARRTGYTCRMIDALLIPASGKLLEE